MIRDLVRILRWAGPHRVRLFLGCLCSFLATWAAAVPIMASAWSLSRVIEAAHGGRALSDVEIGVAVAAVVVGVALRFVLSYAKNRLQESIGYEIAAQERLAIGEALRRLPLGRVAGAGTGGILSLATTELSTLELQGMKMVDLLVNGYLSALAIVVCLAVMDPVAALVAALGVALSATALIGVGAASRRLAPVVHARGEELSGRIVDFMRGLDTAKSYGRASIAVEGVERAIDRKRDADIAVERRFTPYNVAHLTVLRLSSVGVAAACTASLIGGGMPLWMYLTAMCFTFTMFSELEQASDSVHVMGALGDVLDHLDAFGSARPIDRDGRDVTLERHDIAFRDVRFSYDDGREVLHGVDLTIPERTTCAIVGPSGAGKSTIAGLMVRFHDVDSGVVAVGGHDVRELTCDSLMRNFTMVFQNVYLFDDTIGNNIRFGRPDATREQVEDAARRARCDEFVRRLPDGYDTRVGRGGQALSGGERQRIAIARAILKDAPIVILDEATASIDPENERLIQQAIDELTRDRTVVVIAHRLATIRNADQIVVVDDGRVVQHGTHDQLVRVPGVYRRFEAIRAQGEGWRL